MKTPSLALVGLVALTACGTDPQEPDPGADEFPPRLSEFPTAGTAYEPQYELWTNGAVKIRTVSIPSAAMINTSDRDRWDFPDGTVFTKTFAYAQASGGPLRNIETRIIRKRNGTFETAVYLWDPGQTDAELLTLSNQTPVSVTDAQGTTFDHLVPSAADCQTCHAASPAFVLGFGELQLNAPITGGTTTQLTGFAQSNWLSALPADPETIAGDANTQAVLGYVQANCAHCHNGVGVFDLRPRNFLANTVDMAGISGGTLIAPGDPDGSLIYTRFSTGTMPPLGVQQRDETTDALIRAWITSHDFSQTP